MNNIDFRLIRAAVALADYLSFSRACAHLHITQPALTKQIQDLEAALGVPLFERNTRGVRVTDAGQAFIQEARLCLLHHHRASEAAKSVASGVESVLHFGHSPYIDPVFASIVSAVQLPLYPGLQVKFFGDYSPELVRRLLVGELDVALLTAGTEEKRLACFELARNPLYLLMNEELLHSFDQDSISLPNLNDVPWIVFAQHVHPFLYERLMTRAKESRTIPRELHHVTNAEQAALLVKKNRGVAFLNKHGAWRVAVDGLAVYPLCEEDLCARSVLATSLDAGRLVGEFVRAAVKKVQAVSKPWQEMLPLAG